MRVLSAGDWFGNLEQTGTPVDPSFDWALIVKALSTLLLETEHFAVLSACVGYIYNYQHLFAAYARRVVLIELLFEVPMVTPLAYLAVGFFKGLVLSVAAPTGC
jgi:hypothetical protein